MLLTYEDCHSRLLARKRRSGDVVHRCEAATMSGEREWQPCGRFLEALGLRRAFGTMNHIAPAGAPCRGPPETVLIGQEHRDVV
jgi:hypothetical protein